MTSNHEDGSRAPGSSRRPGPLGRFAGALAALLALAVLLAAAPVAHAASPIHGRDSVLVLHSYSQDFVWTRSQQEGIDAVLGAYASAYEVRIEYLDAVHHPELLKGRLVLDLFRAKLADQRFRLVLTSDNAAFDFARAHRAALFPGVPIVFMGLNGYEDSMLRGEKGITGVAEDPDLSGTLQVLLQLVPQTKRIVFPGMVNDLTYRAIRGTVAKDLAALPPQVVAEFPEYPDVDAALEAVRTLPPDAAIVIMTNMRTRDGEGISSQRVVELVSAAASVPVFTNWDFVVGHGAVGGSVISGVEQGRQAAEIAVQILRGERPESIPVHRGAGKTFLFDHRQLARYDIPASRLPPGAVTLFSPERSFRVSRETAWIAGVSFAVLLGMTISLVLSVRRRRRAEEQVHALNRELEGRVRERTAQLESANKELESFAYSVSHDLRAPLRHIDGYVDLLVSRCRDSLSEKGKYYADTIAGSARQMGVLIDELLQFSRTGRVDLHRERLDMNQALQEALTLIRESNAGRTIEWVIGELPSVLGDSALLRQVWTNLLENAVKYTRPRTAARIEISAREGDGEIVFAIADNGVGFDMKYADKLFGVFKRLHSQDEFEGIGIGLANVHRIIGRHGGRTWAEGKVDGGATFYFSLPQAAVSGGSSRRKSA